MFEYTVRTIKLLSSITEHYIAKNIWTEQYVMAEHSKSMGIDLLQPPLL